jgi:2-keto-4-pentenoate hydratase/2-oxohepta-3-ene-1,7-dioic acid hydratase in catechol pathway
MKIFCIGRNFAEHARELKHDIPEDPVVFMKPSTALLKNGTNFYYPDFSSCIHYECELVLRVSKNGKFIQQQFAHKYFDEITVGIDFTARDLQLKLKQNGLPWELAKSFDGSAIAGNFIPFNNLNPDKGILFSLKKNNQIVQQGNSHNMIFNFSKIISFLSFYFTLQKGDLIYTGTPAGVGEVAVGDSLEAFIHDQKLLWCNIC